MIMALLAQSADPAVLLPGAPKMLVIVDTEEEFDWSKPHSRSQTAINHLREQHRAQSILARYRVRPTYVVDYPVASQENGYALLRDWLADKQCQIGAHLHPWVNPPFVEGDDSLRHTYPGNLPAHLEREKLARLTDIIEANFGQKPTVYRAGRYGIGPATGGILEQLGYQVDTSVVPFTDFSDDGGPDFSAFGVEPFWLGAARRVLEIPLTASWCGTLKAFARTLQPRLMSDLGLRLHLPGIFARSRLLERIRLTPEGTTFAELKRLTDAMLAEGRRLFVFSYHSPSVVPGNTPYVRDGRDLDRFLSLIDRYCEYFFSNCRGVATTPHEVHAAYNEDRSHRLLERHSSPTVSGGLPGNASHLGERHRR